MKEINIKLLALSMVPGVGRISELHYIQNNDIENQTTDEIVETIRQLAESNKKIHIPTIDQFEGLCEKSKDILKKQEQQGIVAINYLDEIYPEKFKELHNPPILFFAKGNLDLLKENRHVAVIGKRNPTDVGADFAKRVGRLLGYNGKIVVSGLAVGCDTCGHIGCLEGKGKTIAMLPSPITDVVPECNRELADRIVQENGLLISEYYCGQKVRKNFFIERDRLQAGLSDAIIVAETGETGGTWHAINTGIKLGRDIACYQLPDEYLEAGHGNGNQKLISDDIAIPLESRSEIELYILTLLH